MAKSKYTNGEPIVVKKYANRRLYNTHSSSYVTLDHLAEMVKEGADFIVLDVKTGDDITRTVLAQIIFEKESTDANMLPAKFLRQLISFYGDGLQTMVPDYLQSAMEAFSKNQDEFRKLLINARKSPLTGTMPIFEEMARQNMKLFEQAVEVLNPFAPKGNIAKGLLSGIPSLSGRKSQAGEDTSEPADELAADSKKIAQTDDEPSRDDTLSALQTQLAALQKQVEQLSQK